MIRSCNAVSLASGLLAFVLFTLALFAVPSRVYADLPGECQVMCEAEGYSSDFCSAYCTVDPDCPGYKTCNGSPGCIIDSNSNCPVNAVCGSLDPTQQALCDRHCKCKCVTMDDNGNCTKCGCDK
jgi:hypothetical protein